MHERLQRAEADGVVHHALDYELLALPIERRGAFDNQRAGGCFHGFPAPLGAQLFHRLQVHFLDQPLVDPGDELLVFRRERGVFVGFGCGCGQVENPAVAVNRRFAIVLPQRHFLTPLCGRRRRRLTAAP